MEQFVARLGLLPQPVATTATDLK